MTGGREGRVAVTMPQLGETVAEGTVLRWLKRVGDTVADQEPLLEISTDKVDAEVPSPAGGVLAEIVVSEDETVDVGTVLGHVAIGAAPTGQRAAAAGAPPAGPMAEEGSPSPPNGARSSPAAPPQQDVAPRPNASTPRPQPSTGPRHRHTPRVRRLAHDGGVDLASLAGTGPGGRVTPDDVARFTSAVVREAPSTIGKVPEPTPSRGAGAGVASDRAFRSMLAEVDVPATRWASSCDAAAHAVPGPAAAQFLAAVAGALRGHPSLLAPGRGGSAGDLAVSWSSGSGTVRTLLSQAAELNVRGVSQRLLIGATSDVDPAGVGFSVSFLQDGDVLFEVAAPPPGHVASIVFGAPTERVVVVHTDGSPGIAIRWRTYVAVNHDPGTVPREVALAFLRDVVARAGSCS